ncbi:hypothetical protein B5X24_HaOG203072 [Helicoverpa armigera]|uniref:Uncharacterized protein n=1 Tax=Helicoverpa armigera TaxID=29058 RepID=A0A2W1BVN4_HELAM|nr:hypothetical protein B5X24_HaOG203072 [Helicoverpa armigera]
MPRPVRAASGRCLPKSPSQGQPRGPSQGQSRDASASETSRAPSAASLIRDSDDVSTDLSDTESQMSGTSGVATRQARKRAFLKRGSVDSSDAAEKPAKRAVLQANLEEQPARRSRAKASHGASTVLYADHRSNLARNGSCNITHGRCVAFLLELGGHTAVCLDKTPLNPRVSQQLYKLHPT